MIGQQKKCKGDGNDMTYLKWWKGGICNQEYSDQQGSHSDLIEKFKKKTLQTSKS